MKRMWMSTAAVTLGLLACGVEAETPEATDIQATAKTEIGEDDDFVTRPLLESEVDGHPIAARMGPQVVYLNFDGAFIRKSGYAFDNAQTNTSHVPTGDANIPSFNHGPWGGDRGQVIGGVVAGLRADFRGFDVTFTTSRPTSGAYTMIVVGGSPTHIGWNGGYLGLAPLDPGNANQSDVGFVFSEPHASNGYTARHLAWTIAHEFGHTFGLKHIDRSSDVMRASACHCNQSWGAGNVTDQGGGYQDDNAVLREVFPGRVTLSHPALGMARTGDGGGYWVVAADGGIFSFGNATFHGSTGAIQLNKPIVAMAATPDGQGYWLVASDGGIFSFGNAAFHGSTGNMALNKPIVGMAPTPGGGGYWLVATDGGIFAFGNAGFHGSTGSIALNRPIVGMAATPDGGGYWLVASDGGIFAFGNATFHGSTGAIQLNKPIVGMASTADGGGYWLVASDGGIFAFGNAGFFGSLGGVPLAGDVVGMVAAPDGQGYWMVGSDGAVFAFGSARFFGSPG